MYSLHLLEPWSLHSSSEIAQQSIPLVHYLGYLELCFLSSYATGMFTQIRSFTFSFTGTTQVIYSPLILLMGALILLCLISVGCHIISFHCLHNQFCRRFTTLCKQLFKHWRSHIGISTWFHTSVHP